MISETGYWKVDADRINGEPCDAGLMAELIKFINEHNIRYVYDFGCGAGKYVRLFREAGLVASGYDGNPITGTFDYCHVLDLTSEITLPKVGFVLSLEVGEHIPAEYEGKFIDNLCNCLDNGGYLVLSWAVPGQGGYGHVNEKTNEDVIKLIGLTFDQELTDRFRESVSEAPWFKNTLMVFHK